MKLSQAIEEFKNWRGFKVTGHTVVRYDSVLRIFCLCMGDPNIEQVQIQHVLWYMQEMERLGWKRNGINIVALALRKFFEFYNLRGYKCLNESLIPLPRKEYNIPRVANEMDFNKLLKAIPRNDRPNNIRNLALITLVWDSWARSGEIISLNESDLKFKPDLSGSALIKTEKSRGRRPIREIFWTASTGKNIKKWIKKKRHLIDSGSIKPSDPEALFISIQKCGQYGRPGNRMTNRGVCEVFRTLSNQAGLPTIFNAHSARHYGGREIIKRGGSNSDVSNILGHSHMDSSMIYTMMWGGELQERYNYLKNKKKVNLKHITGEQALNAFVEFLQKNEGLPKNSLFIGDIAKRAELKNRGKFTRY
jgi:integrase/recombinase XerC